MARHIDREKTKKAWAGDLGFGGMHADLNETYCVGNTDAKGRELVAATYDCLWRAIQMCKPGVLYRDVGDVITKEAKLHKLSVVRTYCKGMGGEQ